MQRYQNALRALCQNWGYYPPSITEKAAVFGAIVTVVPLRDVNSANSRVQFYLSLPESTPYPDDGRFVLTTTVGMVALKTCEIIFYSLKGRLARLPRKARPDISSKHIHATAIEHLIKNKPQKVVKGCVRSAEHFRNAWHCMEQQSTSDCVHLSLVTVVEIVHRKRVQTSRELSCATRDVGEYRDEQDILVSILNTYAGGIAVKFKLLKEVHFKLRLPMVMKICR